MKTLMMVKKILEKVAETAAAAVMMRIVLTTMSLLRRLTSLAEMLENLPLMQFCIKLVNSWVVNSSINNYLVNLNLRRSCKVGLRRM
jgi:hypothetical protein